MASLNINRLIFEPAEKFYTGHQPQWTNAMWPKHKIINIT
jgi:hypothetical protein